jgi:hypothetical protein
MVNVKESSLPNSPPPGYRQIMEFSLRKNPRAMLILNGVGFVLFLAAAFSLLFYIQLARPQESPGFSGSIGSLSEMIWIIIFLLLDVILLILLHEAVHGICFWLITGKRPIFSIGPGYAAAAAPHSFISKKPYQVTALSPLVFLTLVGLLLIPFVASGILFYLGLFIVMNISGAVGDLWVVFSLLPKSEPVLVQDFGDRVIVYQLE